MSEIEKFLTPTEDEQVALVLQGKCPHNKGWMFHAFGHNDKSYKCLECGELKFY